MTTRFLLIFAGAVITLLLVFAPSCHEGSVTRPPTGPETDYPCGVWGHTCIGGGCCPLNHICGGPNAAGFQRCEPGYCCYDGDHWPNVGARPDGGVTTPEQPPPVPQRRPDGGTVRP